MRALIAVVAMLPVLAVAGPITKAVDSCHSASQFAQYARGSMEHGVGIERFISEQIEPLKKKGIYTDYLSEMAGIGYNYKIMDAYGYAFARCMKQYARDEPIELNPKLPGE